MVIVDPANLDSEIIETNNVISKKWYRSSMPVPIITKSRNIKIEKRFYFKVYDIQGRVVLQSHNGVNILHDNKINKYYKRFILD